MRTAFPIDPALRIKDPLSAAFVIAAIVVFVLIFLNAMAFGRGGAFTPVKTPATRDLARAERQRGAQRERRPVRLAGRVTRAVERRVAGTVEWRHARADGCAIGGANQLLGRPRAGRILGPCDCGFGRRSGPHGGRRLGGG